MSDNFLTEEQEKHFELLKSLERPATPNAEMPAFAVGNETWNQAGLTKREYFAAMAMQATISGGFTWSDDAGEVAKEAIKYSDAILKELEK